MIRVLIAAVAGLTLFAGMIAVPVVTTVVPRVVGTVVPTVVQTVVPIVVRTVTQATNRTAD
jgi:tetrahydromethanopterin S-methyltransferase subunit C